MTGGAIPNHDDNHPGHRAQQRGQQTREETMSDLQPIADRVEIEALRGEFTDATMDRDDDRLASHGRSTTPLTCAWCGTSYRSIVKLLDHVDCCHLPDESSAASTLTRRLTAA
jgi:hypothetical protein